MRSAFLTRTSAAATQASSHTATRSPCWPTLPKPSASMYSSASTSSQPASIYLGRALSPCLSPKLLTGRSTDRRSPPQPMDIVDRTRSLRQAVRGDGRGSEARRLAQWLAAGEGDGVGGLSFHPADQSQWPEERGRLARVVFLMRRRVCDHRAAPGTLEHRPPVRH